MIFPGAVVTLWLFSPANLCVRVASGLGNGLNSDKTSVHWDPFGDPSGEKRVQLWGRCGQTRDETARLRPLGL
jgi:hypothetical protein